MTKLLLALSLLLAIGNFGTNSLKIPQRVKVEMVSSKEMKEILKQYPNAIEMSRKVHVQPETQDAQNGIEPALSQRNVTLEYYFGERVAGDWIVASDQQNNTWATPQDAQMMLTYPENGTDGNIVSYASMKVRQSTHNGKATIIWDGISFRFIRIIVEAYQTYIFDYDVNIYGY